MTIVITGWGSRIASEFRDMLPSKEAVFHGKPLEPDFPIDADRYFFCQGLLRPKSIKDQTRAEIREGLEVNCNSIIRVCDAIFARKRPVRIAIMGSESGYRSSFDENYAAAKAQLHHYIQNRKPTGPAQQIVGISPGIIGDAGMTIRRLDVETVDRRAREHPKGRHITSREVANLVKNLLYFQSDFITNVVIRMHGGDI
jgi:NAD(P)-dependent dehydrogenase (short-subunit alcohol dehydrogenase family)